MPHRYSPSHWAAGAGGVARKALQVLIKDSVDNADLTLAFNYRVWSWQRRTPMVAGDWRAKSVVTSTASPLRSSLPLLRRPRRPPMPSSLLPKLECLINIVYSVCMYTCSSVLHFWLTRVFAAHLAAGPKWWLRPLWPSATEAARYCTELWIPSVARRTEKMRGSFYFISEE